MTDKQPLTTEKIVNNIKHIFKKTAEKVFEERPLLFGKIEEIPTILIYFDHRNARKLSHDGDDRHTYYLISNFDQSIEVLTQLDILRNESINEMKKNYLKQAQLNESAYLVVTVFKPINWK